MAKRGRPKGSKNKPKQKKQTYIALVIDRSGSMSGVRDAAFTGINEQLNTIRFNAAKGGETFVTYIQFDDQIETVLDKVDANTVKDITKAQYEPRGATAMLDAIGTAIEGFEKSVTETEDTAYLLIVISDGYENASQKYNYSSLAEKVKKLEATNKWTFTYMLSNVDLESMAKLLGSSKGNMSSFISTNTGTKAAFANSAVSSAQYMSYRVAGVTSVPNFYQPAPATATPPVNPTLTIPTSTTDDSEDNSGPA